MNPTSEILLSALELTPVEPDFLDEAYTATTQYVPVAQGLRRGHGGPGRGSSHALGGG